MGYRVLVVDDSLVFQRVMAQILRQLPTISAVEVANDGREGLARLDQSLFDIVFMDLNMPGLNGLDVLRELKHRGSRVPVVVVSAAGGPGTKITIEALEYGALDFICKPVGSDFQAAVNQLGRELAKSLRILDLRKSGLAAGSPHEQLPRYRRHGESVSLVAMASSTGGPQSLVSVIPHLPASFPVPVLLVQHMPPGFTDSMARSLDQKSRVRVLEAAEGMVLKPGTVYMAPGGRHMVVTRTKTDLVLGLNDDPPQCHVRPAADVLLRSLAGITGLGKVLTVIMTGMGKDGCRGLQELKKFPCHSIAQDEESSVVYGMPGAIVEAGLADEILPLDSLAAKMVELALPVVRTRILNH